MLKYNKKLKTNSRHLRNNSTDAEILLWSKLRLKQMHNIQFYRQKPIGNYIVDFYAPSARLIIEVDGEQHLDARRIKKDKERDEFMEKLGLKTMRFDNLQILHSIDEVMDVIFDLLTERLFKGDSKVGGS